MAIPLCNRCKVEPRFVGPTGKSHSWCLACMREHKRARRSRFTVGMCRTCGIRPVVDGLAACGPCRSAVAAWRANHVDEVLAHGSNSHHIRRCRLAGASEVESINRQAVWDRDGGVCGICGQAADPDKWDMDHIDPVVQGGANTMSNVRVSHPTCNRSRKRKSPSEEGLSAAAG